MRLTTVFSDEEIERALFQMGQTKTLGPDGLPTLFYQRHSPLVQDEVCRALIDFLNINDVPVDFNDIVLVLILKVNYT